MQVLEVHSAFLSNFEVLQLLQEDVQHQNAAFRQFKLDAKKLNTSGRMIPGQPYFDEPAHLAKLVPDNLRTLQVESLRYLKNPALPCVHQNPESLKTVLKAISTVEPIPSEDPTLDHGLTKIERLMLVNLAPTKPVDLNIIIDDLDLRFSEDAQNELLAIFQESLAQAGIQRQADSAMQAVKQETNEMQDAAEEHDQEMAQLEEEVYEDEEVYNEEQIMPDEENDLIDEGVGDGGRDAAHHEIDEVDES